MDSTFIVFFNKAIKTYLLGGCFQFFSAKIKIMNNNVITYDIIYLLKDVLPT